MNELITEFESVGIQSIKASKFIIFSVYGLKFCIIQKEDNITANILKKKDITAVTIAFSENEYELYNCATKETYKWKSVTNKIKKHLDQCECIYCNKKREIRNEIFYNIASSSQIIC